MSGRNRLVAFAVAVGAAVAAVAVVRWAFILPLELGVPLEWIVYYPAKLPSLLVASISGREIIGGQRELIIAVVWAGLALGVRWWLRRRRDASRRGGENARRTMSIARVLGRIAAVLGVGFLVVVFWGYEGVGFIPTHPGPGLANIRYATGLWFPSRTRLISSHYGGGCQEFPWSMQLEMARSQVPQMLRSLPPGFRIARRVKPPIIYQPIGVSPTVLSWNSRDGGQGTTVERVTENDYFVKAVMIQENRDSRVVRVYISCLL